jgi:hypothetical protein
VRYSSAFTALAGVLLLSACGGDTGDNPCWREESTVPEDASPVGGQEEAQHLTNQACTQADTGRCKATEGNSGDRSFGGPLAEGVTIQVVDGLSGNSITEFSYCYLLVSPGRYHWEHEQFVAPGSMPVGVIPARQWQQVRSPTGSAQIMLPSSGELTVLVKADGYRGNRGSESEFCFDLLSIDTRRTFQCGLERAVGPAATDARRPDGGSQADRDVAARAEKPDIQGVTVRGSISPGGAAVAGAKLMLKKGLISDDDPSVLKTTVDADGRFRFDHVPPGAYVFVVAGDLAALIRPRCVIVSDGALELDPLVLPATGRVFGQAFWPKDHGDLSLRGRPHSFAGGAIIDGRQRSISLDESIMFKADENGRFDVDGVPAGRVGVAFSRQRFLQDVRVAMVVAGEATEVRLFDPSGTWDLPFEFAAGQSGNTPTTEDTTMAPDALQASPLLAALQPRDDLPFSFSAKVLAPFAGQYMVPDVHPGPCRLRLYREFKGFRLGPIREAEVQANAAGRPVVLPGNSAKVRLRLKSGNLGRLLDYTAVRLDEPAGTGPVEFRLPRDVTIDYLPPGKYVFLAREADDHFHPPEQMNSYSRLENVIIPANATTDVELPALQAGGMISGRVRIEPGCWPLFLTIRAADRRGVVLELNDFQCIPDKTFTFPGLWPGEWTVTLREGKKVLAAAKATSRDNKTVQCDLVLSRSNSPDRTLLPGPVKTH